MTIRSRISGTGMYVPERILTNSDLEKLVDTSDTWIQERTGVRERHIAADHETASTLGIQAAQQALAQAEVSPGDLDLVIASTTSPDGMFPAIASRIQDGLGANHAGAFDVNAACVGFLSALATASQFIATGTYQRILVIGSEVLSRMTDWTDRSTCLLFGDGAGAVVLEAAEQGGPLSFVLHSDGSGAQSLYANGPCSAPKGLETDRYFISMDGRHIFKFAVQAMESAVREAIDKAGLDMRDVDLMVP
ncbi:MAG: beta-ketoacyl-ACP synthase 3, partial [Chloroflexi bacterium]|nr:beta-ketoacyl-ACP synthase 3 [Chloroflexota bacterium]